MTKELQKSIQELLENWERKAPPIDFQVAVLLELFVAYHRTTIIQMAEQIKETRVG